METNGLQKGEIIILEEEKEFAVLEILELEGKKYLLLANIADDGEIAIRVENLANNTIDGLDSEEELAKISIAFAQSLGVFE